MERRNFIKSICAASALVATLTPSGLFAKETPKSENALGYDAAVAAITGGKVVKDSDKIKLTVPEIAENGAVVPVKVYVESSRE